MTYLKIILDSCIILMYNAYMRLESLPDFAKPLKKRGYDVRERKGTYFLYKVTSKRVPGKSYPMLEQEYIGVIDSTGKLIRKKEYPSKKKREYLEWGLSSFIMARYKRTLLRSAYNGSAGKNLELIELAAIRYAFGTLSETAIRRCHLAKEDADKLVNLSTVVSVERIARLSNKIGELQRASFGDDLEDAEILMRLCVIERDSIEEPGYSDELLALFGKHGIEL